MGNSKFRNLEYPGRSPVAAPNGMASTSHPLSTQAAIRVLQDGGNALDAAIAAAAVQGVVEPQSTGIGGDCFVLYAPAGKQDIIAFNGSGRAPAGLSSEGLLETGVSKIDLTSPHAVTIPGAVDAWVRLNRDHGRTDLARLLAPAIEYARNGYPITQRVSKDFALAAPRLDADARAVFCPSGNPVGLGERHAQPALARTLELIATKGRDGFYKGEVADDILAKLNSRGGMQTQDDFNRAGGDYVTPISAPFRGQTIWQCPPNGQGVIALMLLNIMSDIPTFGDDPLSVDRIHHEIEAGRLAYRDRNAVLADPDQVNVPVDHMLQPEYAAKLRDMIKPDIRIDPMPASQLTSHASTVYISVVDRDRNVCSFINTLFWGFGSGIMAPKSGVLLQNRGAGFVVDPNHPNGVQPNKRPLHTIIPGMATKDGRPTLCFGVMGGDYQAFGHMQLLTRMYDYDMDIQMAQDTARFFPHPFADSVEVEAPISEDIRNTLRQRGHPIKPASRPIGGSQAIAINWHTGLLTAGSDPRKDGCAMGY